MLWYLIAGTRGGQTRAMILKNLIDRPYNANQLAESMNMDYKTIRHHLEVLVKNGVITMEGDKYGAMYFISKTMEANLNEFNQIWAKINK
ncbi:Bacterial regulatory protein, arsR family [uncultured archaeon]|nr:Bacterial regulatory protein, arsR family [uncultured archaeon]